jgi:hypothetical protein
MILEPTQKALTRSVLTTFAMSPPILSYFNWGSSSSSSWSSSSSSSSSSVSTGGSPSSSGGFEGDGRDGEDGIGGGDGDAVQGKIIQSSGVNDQPN